MRPARAQRYAMCMKKPPCVAALLALLCAGCSRYEVASITTPLVAVDAQPPERHALVCLLRGSVVGAALTIPVHDGDTLVGATDGPGWFCYFAAEGHHLLQVGVSDADPLSFEVVGGERIHVELAIRFGQDELRRIDAGQARAIAAGHGFAIIESAPEGETIPEGIVVAPAQRVRTSSE